eukprot:m.13048 g.13048  ORF g.13048 m.13048 type:complete len:656 (+) comp24460_c0_seq2:146-2113(+)
MDHYTTSHGQYGDYGETGQTHYPVDYERSYEPSTYSQYDEDVYSGPTERLECVASLVSHLLGRLTLMPILSFSSVQDDRNYMARFAGQCVNWVEALTFRMGLLDHSGPGYAIWINEVNTMKKLFTGGQHTAPMICSETQRNLLEVGRFILEELRRLDEGKSDVFAVFHTGYLTAKMCLDLSLSSTFQHDDAVVFLKVIHDLPADRITTFLKDHLKQASEMLHIFVEGNGLSVGQSLISELSHITVKIDNNIKAGKSASAAKSSKRSTPAVRRTKEKGIAVDLKPGKYVVQETTADGHYKGHPRLINVYPQEKEGPRQTTKPKLQKPTSNDGATNGLSTSAGQPAAASKSVKASELGLTDEEFAQCYEQQLSLEDQQARQKMSSKRGSGAEEPLPHGQTDEKGRVLLVFFAGGRRREQAGSVKQEGGGPQILEMPSDDDDDDILVHAKDTKTTSLGGNEKNDAFSRAKDSDQSSRKRQVLIAKLKEDVKETREVWEQRRQVYDSLLADIQQLQLAINDEDAPAIIKSTLEEEKKSKVQNVSVMADELVISRQRYASAEEALATQTTTESCSLIDDLDEETTYSFLLDNLKRTRREEPDKLHLMLKRHLDILTSETLEKLAEKLDVTATDREERVQEIKKRHEDAFADEFVQDEELD